MIETRLPLVMSKPRPARSALLAAALAAVAVVLAPVATLAAGPKRAGVPKFDGAQEALVRKQVMQQLKAHGYELAKSREVETAMQNTGALLESDDGFQKVAKELALTVIVTGEVGKKRAKITVHDGREGSVLGEASFPGANPKKIAAEVGKTFWSKLGEDLARGHVPSGSKKPQKVVAEAPEDDENAPDTGGDEGNAAPPPPEPKPRKQKTEEVAAAEGGEAAPSGEEEAPPKKKKKKKKVKMEEEAGQDEESGPTTIPPTFEFALGGAGLIRNLSYNDDVSMMFNPNDPGMRPYSLPFGPEVAAHAVWYPLSLLTDGPVQHLGIEGGLEQGFAIQSSVGAGDSTFPQGATFGTTVHEFEGGLRYRIPFGLAGNQVWFSLGGGEHAFVFTGRSKYTAMNASMILDIPDTIYRYIRPGVGVRFELGANFALAADVGFRAILNGAGPQFDQFFPHHSVYGADADAYVGYRILENLEVRLGAEFRQYGYAMNSTQADKTAIMMSTQNPVVLKIAGGAVDRYISVGAGVAFMFGGTPRPEAPEEEEAPPPPKKKKKHHHEDEDEGGGGGEPSGGGGGDTDQ